VGSKRFFKKHYLLLLCLSLFLLVGFFVGTKKVLASYGSSIYKFFYMGIVPMPPPVTTPLYEVEKKALPNSQGSYSFESGNFVRYLIKVKSSLLSGRYKSQTYDFNTNQSDISPFQSNSNQFKWKENCGKNGGCIGIDTVVPNVFDLYTKEEFLIGPRGAIVSFDYKLNNVSGVLYFSSKNLTTGQTRTFTKSFGGYGFTDWTNLSIEMPANGNDEVGSLHFYFDKKIYTPNYFYLDNFKIQVNDEVQSLVGSIEDPLPKVGDLQAMDFLPNLYPSTDKESGKTKYVELSGSYKSEWIVGAKDLDDKEIMNLQNWNAFKLCNDYYQAWQRNEDYKGYPTPIKTQLEYIADTDSSKPCIDFSWQDKNLLIFKNLTIPFYNENKALYIRYSFKVR